MIIGLCTLDLYIPQSQSLKDKRRVVQSVIAHLRNDFNVSVAEVDQQDRWQQATLAVACVSSDRRYAQGLLERVVRSVQGREHRLILVDYAVEML